jgi:hypothetical protein
MRHISTVTRKNPAPALSIRCGPLKDFLGKCGVAMLQ